jgi:hypothetical protein
MPVPRKPEVLNVNLRVDVHHHIQPDSSEVEAIIKRVTDVMAKKFATFMKGVRKTI